MFDGGPLSPSVPRGTALSKRIKEIPSKGLPDRRRSVADGFDETYGVKTSRFVQIVPTDSPNLAHGSRYSSAPELSVRCPGGSDAATA